MAGSRDYKWTPTRIALGVLIVLTAAGFVGFIGADHLRALRQASVDDARYARFLEMAVEDQAAGFNTDNLVVPREQIAFGGPPKDGIPSLTDPETVPVADAGHLQDDDRVVGVTSGGEARAYPIRVLMYHEAYNDTVGGVPIAAVYCPLCDSVSVVDRRLDGETYEFGISGLLVNSNVLLYDRTDDALWSQLGFEAISGPNAGRSLKHLPWTLTTFGAWRDAHPDSTVATLDTGHERDYGRTPYGDYFDSDRLLFQVEHQDDRLPVKEQVVGVELGDEARAYPTAAIREAGELTDEIAGARVVLAADAASDTVRVVNAPAGARVAHTFWFAWAAFHPETDVYRP